MRDCHGRVTGRWQSRCLRETVIEGFWGTYRGVKRRLPFRGLKETTI